MIRGASLLILSFSFEDILEYILIIAKIILENDILIKYQRELVYNFIQRMLKSKKI